MQPDLFDPADVLTTQRESPLTPDASGAHVYEAEAIQAERVALAHERRGRRSNAEAMRDYAERCRTEAGRLRKQHEGREHVRASIYGAGA
jgi:hypothetical protein